MSTGRLSAFSDGVFAIIITIIVLGVSFPTSYAAPELTAFLWEVFVFIESGLIVGSFWYSHSTLLAEVDSVPIHVALCNIVYLLLLSLLPLFTHGVLRNPDATFPILGVGAVILLTSASFRLLARMVSKLPHAHHPPDNALRNFWFVFAVAFWIIITAISLAWPRIAAGVLIFFPIGWWIILLRIHGRPPSQEDPRSRPPLSVKTRRTRSQGSSSEETIA